MRHKLTGPGPGHPKGMKNKLTKIKEAAQFGNKEHYVMVIQKEGKAIIDRWILAAKMGQPWAIQIFIEREFGKVKEVLEITKPPLTNDEAMALIRQYEKEKLNGSTSG